MTEPAPLEKLIDDRRLTRNVGFNLAGWALPAVAALISVPILARGLGADRFGLLALTWAAVGVFSLFDFGLGRALTRLIAARLAVGQTRDVADLIWTTTWMLLLLTGALSLAGFLAAPAIVRGLLDVPPALEQEAIGVVRLIALSIAPLASGVAMRGVFEGAQNFAIVNQLRVPLGLVTYAGPLLALAFGGDSRIAVGVIVAGRVIYWLAHFPLLNTLAPGLASPRRWSPAAAREISHVGGWITVSNVVSPIIVQADRAVVAAAFPIAASGWYGAAAEVATKQWLFTAAIGPVFFSAVSAALTGAPARAAELTERASKVTLLALLPVSLALIVFAEPGLRLWLGDVYAIDAARILQLLTLGVYVNCVGQMPYFALQGGVDARSPALLHLIELPIYLVVLTLLSRTLGVTGVALAWMLRMVLDPILMWMIYYVRLPEARPSVLRTARLGGACLLILGVAAALTFAR